MAFDVTAWLSALGLEQYAGAFVANDIDEQALPAVTVIGEELAHGKPHPLPYLTAMQLLGANASGSIAFEDSRSGVRAAGVETIGLTTALGEDVLRGAGASMVVQDFASPALIRHLHHRSIE